MNKSNILVYILWFLLVAQGLVQGLTMSDSLIVNQLPDSEITAYIFLFFPFVFFTIAVFFQREKMFRTKMLTSLVDGVLGEGSLEKFTFKLRPTLLFMVAILTLGLSGLITSFLKNGPAGAYILSGFFISGGTGILAAYLLSLKFPPNVR